MLRILVCLLKGMLNILKEGFFVKNLSIYCCRKVATRSKSITGGAAVAAVVGSGDVSSAVCAVFSSIIRGEGEDLTINQAIPLLIDPKWLLHPIRYQSPVIVAFIG